jgi:hypothetical protein
LTFHDVSDSDLHLHRQTKSSVVLLFVFVHLFVVLAQGDSLEDCIVGLGLAVERVELFVGFVELRMGVFGTGPYHIDVTFESIYKLSVLGDPIETVLELHLTLDQRDFLIHLLFGEAILPQ